MHAIRSAPRRAPVIFLSPRRALPLNRRPGLVLARGDSARRAFGVRAVRFNRLAEGSTHAMVSQWHLYRKASSRTLQNWGNPVACIADAKQQGNFFVTFAVCV
jgi:hypothetical protein